MCSFKFSNRALCLVLAVLMIAMLSLFFVSCSNGEDKVENVDYRLVGKWKFNSNILEFKSNGHFIIDAGTSNETTGTFKTENNVLYMTASSGEQMEKNYRVISDNIVEFEQYYYNSNWKKEYEWVEAYRIV